MTQITITHRYVNQSPRKLRPLAKLVVSQSLDQALARLTLLPQMGRLAITKLLKNASQAALGKNLEPSKLRVVRLLVNEGPRLKRSLPAPRGRSYRITKKTSHLTITLSDNVANHARIGRESSRKRISGHSSKNS